MGQAAWLTAQVYVRVPPKPPAPEMQQTSVPLQLHPAPPSPPMPPSDAPPLELAPPPDEDA
jgi:hypothetical protein